MTSRSQKAAQKPDYPYTEKHRSEDRSETNSPHGEAVNASRKYINENHKQVRELQYKAFTNRKKKAAAPKKAAAKKKSGGTKVGEHLNAIDKAAKNR